MEKQILHDIGSTLVSNLFTNEEMMFEAYGDEIIDLALSGEKSNNLEVEKAEFEFAEDLLVTLNIGIAIFTLVSACVQLKASITAKNNRNNRNKEIIDLFEKMIAKEVQIPNEKMHDLMALLRKTLCP